MPAPKIQSELRTNSKKAGSNLRNLYIRVDVAYTFKQSKVLSAFGTETPTSAYTLFNVGIGADITNSKRNTLFSLSFSTSCLLDIEY